MTTFVSILLCKYTSAMQYQVLATQCRFSFSSFCFFSVHRMNIVIRTVLSEVRTIKSVMLLQRMGCTLSFFFTLKIEQKFYDENICRTFTLKTHHQHPSTVAESRRWSGFRLIFCHLSLCSSKLNKIKVKFVWKLFHVLVLLKTSERQWAMCLSISFSVCVCVTVCEGVLSAKRNKVKSACNNRHIHRSIDKTEWMRRKECNMQKKEM